MSRHDAASQSRSDILLDLALLVTERRGVGEIFADFAARMLDGVAFDYACLFTAAEDPRVVRAVASYPPGVEPRFAGEVFPERSVGLRLLGSAPGGAEYGRGDIPDLVSGRNLMGSGFERAWVIGLPAGPAPLGLLAVARRDPGPFGGPEVAFLREAAGLLAGAVQRDRELCEAQASAARARAANAISLELSSGSPPEDVFARLPELLAGALAFDYASLMRSEGGHLRFLAEYPGAIHDPGTHLFDGIIQPVMELGGIAETRTDSIGELGEHFLAAGVARLLDSVLVTDREPLGLLTFGRRESRPFPPAEHEFVGLISNIFAQAMAGQQRLDRATVAAARSRVLNEVALLLNQGESINAIFQRLLDLIGMAIEVDYVGLLEAGDGRGTMRMVGSRPEVLRPAGAIVPHDELRLDILGKVPGPVVQYPVDHNPDESVFKQAMVEIGMRRGVSIPIHHDGALAGFLSLARRNPDRYGDEEVAFLETLSAMLGQAIVNRHRLDRSESTAARARVLNDAALLINTGAPAESIFDQILPLLHEALEFDYADFFEAATEPGVYRRVAHEPPMEGHERVWRPASYLGIEEVQAMGRGVLGYRLDRIAGQSVGAANLVRSGYTWAAVALGEVDGRVEGVFSLARARDLRFSGDEQRFLVTLARMLGQAIANRRRLEEADRAAARSRLLSEIGVLLNDGSPPEAFFERLAERLQAIVPFAGMALLTAEAEGFRVAASMSGLLLKVGSLVGREDIGTRMLAMLEERPVGEGSLEELGGRLAELGLAAGRRRGAVCALRHQGAEIGHLLLTRSEDEAFRPEECAYLELLGSLLAQAIANRMRLEESQRKAEQSRLLNEISVLVNKGDSPEAFFDHLVARLKVVVPFDALVMFVHEGPEMIRSAGSMTNRLFPVGTRVPLASIGEDLMALIAERSVVEGSNRTTSGALAAQALELGRQRFAVVVLRHEGSAVGYLVLVRTEDEAFSAEDCAYLELVGTLLAQATANRARLEESQRKAEQSRLLNEISMLVNNGDSPGTFFNHLVGRMKGVVPFDAMVMFVHEGPKVIRSAGSMTGRVFPVGTRVELASIGEEMVALLAERRVVEGSTREIGGELTAPVIPLGHERVAVVVLQHEARALGYLALVKKDPAPFSADDCAYLELVGTLLAQATANHQKMEESQAEATRQKLLSELAVMLQDERPIEDHFERLCQALLPAAGFDFIFLSLPDVAGDGYHPLASEVLPFGGERIQFEPEVIPFVRATFGGLTQYRPSHASDRAIPAALARAGFQRAATAIIPDPGGREGIFTIARRDVRPFSEHELEFVKLVAALLGHAQGNRTKAVAREQQALRNRILSELALLLNDGQPVEVHFERLRERLGEAVGFDYISVAARESTSEQFRTLRSTPLLDEAGNEAPFDAASLTFLTENGLRSSQFGPEGVENGAPGNIFTLGLEMVFCGLLSAGTGIEGAFTVGRRAKRRFSREERAFLEAVGGLLSYAIANERRIAMSAQEAEEQAIVARAAAAVATEDGSLAIAAALRNAIGTFVAEPFVNFGFLEGERVNFPGRDGAVSSMPIGPNMRIALDEGVVVVPSPRESGGLEEVIRAAEELGLQNQVMTGARSGGEIIGMLIVGSRDPDYRFGEREVRLVRLITDIIGPGMAHVRAVERERREAEDQRVLAELAAVCAREANPVDILNRMAVALRPLIPRPVTVFGYRHGDEMVYPRADGAWIRLPLDPTFEVVDEMGQSFTDELPEESDPTGILRQLGVRATCTTAIRSAGEIVGYLLVGSREPGFTFRRRERELMRLAAQIVGPAMENARAAMAAREEAEDQRILAEIAAIAAREPDADAIMNALPAAIAPLVPSPLVLNGLIRDHTAVYRVSDPALREMFGVEHAAVPFSPAGFEALERGQATGHTDDLPPEFRAAVSGVHAFALTHYQTAGLRVGTIMVATTDPEYTFSERVLALLRRAAQVVGPALDAARAQEEFDRQRELQGLILRSLTEGVVLLDSVGRAIFANTLGRKVLDAVGAPGMVDTWEESLAIVPEAVREDFSRAVRLGQAGHGRTSLTIDGRRVHLDYEFVPLDHPAFRALLVLADVTSQVQQQEEEERSRERMAQTSRLAALGELIGGVAHELNNPLTAILGFAEIIGLSEAAEPFAEEIGVIQKEALRARNIVRDLLFIARPGTSERGVVPVADIVAHIERLRRSHWSQAGIAAEVRIDPECLAWGNEHQLTQVLLNLVTNAEQALAGREGARLVIAARRQGERVLLTVADNGKGMDDATRARIFEPFFTTRQGIGTGLGLPLSYSIVQSHLGTITVETAPGAGTTFVVDLPVHDEPAEPVEPESPRSRPATLRMLVIDDEPSLRKVCQRLVESLGHSCESAENAAAALKLARGGDFDVVLCDYRLATETADQVLEGLEQQAPHLIPRTILATGATTDAGVVRLVERYGLQLVAKPYGVEELSRILNESAARAG